MSEFTDKSICIGDLVWWDGGVLVGRVVTGIDSKSVVAEKGVTVDPIIIGKANVAQVFLPERSLEGEGFSKIGDHDRQRLHEVECACRAVFRESEPDAEVAVGAGVVCESGRPDRWRITYIYGGGLMMCFDVCFEGDDRTPKRVHPSEIKWNFGIKSSPSESSADRGAGLEF